VAESASAGAGRSGAEVEQQIRSAGGEATYMRADVRDEADVHNFVDQIAAKYGRLDVCFNNAGITVQNARVHLRRM
jgi:NAD(P)-dependent dehydrogenase (short-subunit alcohol dehydrogenase family)